MYFDTHAHYDDSAFSEDLEKTLLRVRNAGVENIIDPGSDVKSTERAMQIAIAREGFYFAAGIHPEQIQDTSTEDLDAIAEFARHEKCVAIGEIGLDYHWDTRFKDEQMILFRSQMALAGELRLPVIIHDRDAHGNSLAVVQDYPEVSGVFHCFSGSAELAEQLIKRGYYLGFDGPVTYKNNKKAAEVLEVCPLDRILLETDSPYLSPVPMRGLRNDSSNLSYICAAVADMKHISPEELAKQTVENAKTCFRIV